MNFTGSMILSCPNCGGDVEVRTQFNSATYLERFSPHEYAPPEVLSDVVGKQVSCDGCGNDFTIGLSLVLI